MKSHAPTSAELLPCPMCGKAPNLVDMCGWEIECDCGLSLCLITPDKEPLVAAWNRRAAMQTAEPVERKLVAWVEPDGDEWHVHGADTELGQHISLYQKDSHYKSVFPLFDGPDPEPGSTVRIPTSSDEAQLMALMGVEYLRNHAPERLKAAPDRATSIDSAAGWISVADRLPEDGVYVWAHWLGAGDWHAEARMGEARRACGGWQPAGCVGFDWNVTYWMPLPPAPAIAALQPEGERDE